MKIDSSCAGVHQYAALLCGKQRRSVRMALLYGASFRLLAKKYPLRLIKTEYKRVCKGYTSPDETMRNILKYVQKSSKQTPCHKKSLVVTYGLA
ncbi:TPA: hypothetical protein ACVU4V_000412 [Vibrio parahaemolyticus]|uniref:Uncharacterized protein n=1 Tax=Vibrio parahaemolyticus TaxID=670 RepID=A0AAW3IVP7_VIBPH|nr:hypothetical protein [Vibrio parahaemolyticus]ELB1136031.1 hypothetical protein [Vibrio parahaemolyticus]ELB7596799.1 hypothetical protein [Vibrio parahaemolyticus]KON58916.1 hypothetical protein ACX02_06310 [Vibrio parahaemolyticus]KOY32284.1 hypothetical protein ACX05_08690 [Vibrio parahaemolyticus]MCG6465421.1 hypothetical protein [Vibrio parahaemolyticus]